MAVVVPAEKSQSPSSWQPAPLVVWAEPVLQVDTTADQGRDEVEAQLPTIGAPAALDARAA